MSIAASKAVWDNSQATGLCRLVMLALADEVRVQSVDTCWPSIGTVARKARCSTRQVRRLIRCLVADGELVLYENQGQVRTPTGVKVTNRYQLCPGGMPVLAGSSDGAASGVPVPTPPSDPGRAEPVLGQTTLAPGRVNTRSPDMAMSAKPAENRDSEPAENRKGRSAGLSGQRVDYEKTAPPTRAEYGGEMYALINQCPDPILAAMAVTGERGKRGWGHWVNAAREVHGDGMATRLFRRCLEQCWGESRAGEWRIRGAGLNTILHRVFSACPPKGPGTVGRGHAGRAVACLSADAEVRRLDVPIQARERRGAE
jgi:hypothetical protein